MRVLSIRESKAGDTYRVTVDTAPKRTSLTVRAATVEAYGHPAAGEELAEEAFAAFVADDSAARALSCAFSLLACADNSKAALGRKLIARGFSSDVAKEAVVTVVSLGYLDESRQMERAIEKMTAEGYGEYRIVPKLASRGYRAADAAKLYRTMKADGRIDPEEAFFALAAKKLPADPDPDAVTALRIRYGFSSSDTF